VIEDYFVRNALKMGTIEYAPDLLFSRQFHSSQCLAPFIVRDMGVVFDCNDVHNKKRRAEVPREGCGVRERFLRDG
jgi:hypothetical protein